MTLLLALVLLPYVLLLALLYLRQRQMIYHPDTAINPPATYALEGFDDLRLPTPDGETLQLWYRTAAEGFPTIVYFHGNASNLSNRIGIYAALAAKGFGILALSYRGYGKSTGHPSEAGLYTDARTAIAYLTRQQHIPAARIILYGESLGTGVAVQMATEFPAAALILQAPYTSVAARAAEIYYYVPVKLLIKDKYHSLAKIVNVRMPLLLFHGEKDAIIPLAHAKRLFEAANEPKQALFFQSLGHNDFDTAVISEHVLAFCRNHKLI